MKRLPMTHFKAAYVCLAVLVTPLAACQTTGNVKLDQIRTKADILVATNAKKLHDYCTLVQLGMGTLGAFVHDAKVQAVLAKAQPAVSAYCSGPPPVDVAQAVNTLISIYGSVVQAQAKVGA